MNTRRDETAQRRLTRAEAQARTRTLLLEAAARTFARKGFASASVEEIAAAAGFSTGALYSNFTSKEALFLELLSARGSDRVTRATQALHEHHDDITAAAPELGRLLINVADQDIDFAPLQAEFWLYAIRNPGVLDTMAARLREPREELARLIGVALARQDAPAEISATSVATVVTALFGGLLRQRRIDPASVPEDLFGHALTWLFAGITGGGAATPDDYRTPTAE